MYGNSFMLFKTTGRVFSFFFNTPGCFPPLSTRIQVFSVFLWAYFSH